MTRLLVYSHDTFGLGNIRRMLSICTHLANATPDISVLLLTGSPLVHNFRLPLHLDYIKLPCITRTGREEYRTKYLDIDLEVIMRLRAGMIRNAVECFRPDVFLVDKKPLGIQSELKAALGHLRRHHCRTRTILVLRDILDSPEATIRTWRSRSYYETIRRLYDDIAVLGSPEIFDVCREYQFTDCLVRKTRFCGYIRRERGRRDAQELRASLQVTRGAPLVLVTVGGGEDASRLLETYARAVPAVGRLVPGVRTLIVHGPELPQAAAIRLAHLTHDWPDVVIRDFSDDLMSYMAAADVVVSMGGYNTICEFLSLNKPAIVVPRVRPVEEQWIRAERMARLGLLRVIHPDRLTPAILAESVAAELSRTRPVTRPWIDMNALDRLAEMIAAPLAASGRPLTIPLLAKESALASAEAI